MKQTIMLVEDERAIRELLIYTLTKEGFNVSPAHRASDAMEHLAQSCPDLILLDWMLPDISGIEFARRLKRTEHYAHIPIIMLTARGTEDDKVRGLDAGADDYVTKPFSSNELLARIRAVLRRLSPLQSSHDRLTFYQLTLDKTIHQVFVNDQRLDIGPTEFRLLAFFLTYPKRVFSRSQLLDQVWGHHVFIEERTVDVHIRRLRKLLTPVNYAQYIQTIRGAGYCWSDTH